MATASFVYAVYPVLARAFVDRPDRLVVVYRQALRYLLAVVLPATAGLAVIAGDLMPALFGATFGPAAIALAILAWGQALDSINPLLTQTLRAADRERRAAGIAAAGAAINVAANLALIPPFGLYGASIATVLAFAALLWLNLRALHKDVGAAHIRGPFVRTAAATVLMAAAIWWLTRSAAAAWPVGWRLAAAVALGSAVYAAAALALGVLHADDRRLLLGIFHRRSPAPKGVS
jgi:O-antigen/teichoic acid export membrane protein